MCLQADAWHLHLAGHYATITSGRAAMGACCTYVDADEGLACWVMPGMLGLGMLLPRVEVRGPATRSVVRGLRR